MVEKTNNIKVALIQATPYFNDITKTLEKTLRLMNKAAQANAKVVVFSQCFLPCYPIDISLGLQFGTSEKIGLDQRYDYYQNSVSLDGYTIKTLQKECAKLKITLSIGVSEYRYEDDQVYNTNLIIDEQGNLASVHRSHVLVGLESMLWRSNNEYDFKPVQTQGIKVGSLTNYENYNPLARARILADNIDLFIAPNSINSEQWQNTIQHLAVESKSYILSCNQYIDLRLLPPNTKTKQLLRGGSAIIAPDGNYLVGPVYDKEAILMADLDLTLNQKERMDLNPALVIRSTKLK